MTFPRVLVVVAGLLCFSSSAFATGVTLTNTGGTFSTLGGGLQLTNAALNLVTGLGSPYDGNVSGDKTTLSFSIGIPKTGSTASGSATWIAGGGSFTFSDSKTGLMFKGTFTCSAAQPCTWSGTSSSSATFAASFEGTLNGQPINGLTAQITFNGINVGGTVATVVPEVGTLGMVGMGLLGIAGFVKLKLSSASKKAA